MPHKRNPITAEKICGLSRVVKANAQVAFDNVALWHERDISHSSAERVAQADSFIALDHMLSKLEFLLDGMVLYPEQMMANLNKTRGMLFSSKVFLPWSTLVLLVKRHTNDCSVQRYEGLGRYSAVQGRTILPGTS